MGLDCHFADYWKNSIDHTWDFLFCFTSLEVSLNYVYTDRQTIYLHLRIELWSSTKCSSSERMRLSVQNSPKESLKHISTQTWIFPTSKTYSIFWYISIVTTTPYRFSYRAAKLQEIPEDGWSTSLLEMSSFDRYLSNHRGLSSWLLLRVVPDCDIGKPLVKLLIFHKWIIVNKTQWIDIR